MFGQQEWVSERSLLYSPVYPSPSNLLKRAYLDRSLPDVLLSSDPNISHAHSLLHPPDLSMVRSSRTSSLAEFGPVCDTAVSVRSALECTLCHSTYVEPKLLPCLHTFCKTCLVSYIPTHSLAAACPKCSIYFILPEIGAADLPDNHFFDKISAYYASSHQKHDLLSSLPTLHSSPLTSSQLALNNHQMKAKLSKKVFSRSMELSITSSKKTIIQQSRETISELAGPLMCQFHIDRRSISYCVTCEIRTCDFCTNSEHKEHEIKSAGEMKEESRELLRKILESCQGRKNKLFQSKDLVYAASNNLERNYKDTEIKLNEHYDRLIRQLQQKQEESLSLLFSVFERRRNLLSRHLQRVGDGVAVADFRCGLLASVLLQDHEEEVLICAKEFAVDDLGLEEEDILLPAIETYLGLSCDEFEVLSRQANNMKSLITTLPISENDIKVVNSSESLNNLLVKKEVRIELRLSEAIARIIGEKAIGSLLQARLCWGGHCLLPRAEYATDPLTARLIFTPNYLGTGLLEITFCGQPIPHSSFKISVVDKEVPLLKKATKTAAPFDCKTPIKGVKRASRPETPINMDKNNRRMMRDSREFDLKSDDNITSVSACAKPKPITNLTRSKTTLSLKNKVLARSQPLNPGVKYSATSALKTRLGSRGRNKGEFLNVQGVVLLKNHNQIAATDPSNHCVQVFDRVSGTCSLKFNKANPAVSSGHLGVPAGVVALKNGNFVVSDYENGCVCVFASDGRYLDRFGHGKLQSPKGMAIDRTGKTLAVVDTKGRSVHFFQVGSWKHTEQLGSKTSDQLIGPHFCAFTPAGDLVISDYNEGTVKVFVRVGSEFRVKFRFGADGRMKAPTGIVVDGKGNIIVADWDSSMIQVYNSSGEFISTVDTFSDPLLKPQGLALTSDGQLVVADSANHCLKIFRYEAPDAASFF